MSAGIEQRGRVWRARVRRSGAYLTATFPSAEEATAWRAQTITALARGERPPTPAPEVALLPPQTVEEAAREWVVGALRGTVRARRGRRYREASVHTHEYRLRLHVLPYLGRLSVTAVSRGTVRRWLEELEAATSATTARGALDSLRVVMRRALEHELIPANPCSGVTPPSRDGEARPLRFLTPTEGAALRAAAVADPHPRIAAFVDLGLATGARRGELLGAVWGPGGLNLEARTLTIATSFSLRTKETGPTKSGASRVVPLGPALVARLREYRMAVGRPADGQRVLPFDPREPWRRSVAAAGLSEPRPTIHALRHSAAAWWLASGLTVHAVAALLGHADPTLVLKLYGHSLPAERSTAGERLEAFLERSS